MPGICTGPELFNGLRSKLQELVAPFIDANVVGSKSVQKSVRNVADSVAFTILGRNRSNEDRMTMLHQVVSDDSLLKSILKPVVRRALDVNPKISIEGGEQFEALNSDPKRFQVLLGEIFARFPRINPNHITLSSTFNNLLTTIKEAYLQQG